MGFHQRELARANIGLLANCSLKKKVKLFIFLMEMISLFHFFFSFLFSFSLFQKHKVMVTQPTTQNK